MLSRIAQTSKACMYMKQKVYEANAAGSQYGNILFKTMLNACWSFLVGRRFSFL